MRTLPPLCLWALLGPGALPWAMGQGPVDRANLVSLSASVLKVEARRADGAFGLGSGVAIARDRVVTNCHVTRDAVRVQVQRGGVRWTADAQHLAPELDLCVLRVPALQAEPVALAPTAQVQPGAPVVALGYTGGAGLQVSDGEVIALHRHAHSWVIQSSNWFSSGASGGGLFNPQRELVGVLTFRLRGADGHYYAAPADWILPLARTEAPLRFQPIEPASPSAPAYWEPGYQPAPRFLQASALAQGGQWARLDALARQWSREEPEDAEPWYLLGLSLAQAAQWDEAEQALQRSLSLQPLGWPAWHRLGLVQVQQGRLDAARASLKRLQAHPGPASDDLHAALARACAQAPGLRPDPLRPGAPGAAPEAAVTGSTSSLVACPAPT